MKKNFILPALFILLFVSSCQEDIDLITPDLDLIYKVKSTEILLRENSWEFNDLIVDVQYEMRAIPLLANVADDDGMVQPGIYNSLDIFGNDHRQKLYTYQFTTLKLNRDTAGSGEYHQLGYYNVLNRTEIRLNPDSAGLATYNYKYSEPEGIFTMTSDHLTNGRINEAMNRMIANAIYSGKPNDIANALINNILGNEVIQDTIQQVLYDLVHGKIDEIAQNPEEISEKLSAIIFQKLKEVDWENLVYNKVLALLEELQVDNPEERAQELAVQIAYRIETNVSQSDIYEAILPILQEFENETLPKLVPVISEAIYGVITNLFSEENIYNKIYPVWISFSQVDSSSIVQLADTLGSVITTHFFDAESLAASLIPFVETLQSTGTLQIPAMAQDIIDEVLIPRVDSLNTTFPGLELEPDWDQVKQILTSALTVLKSNLSGLTIEEAAAQLAESIIGIFDSVITNGIESAIFSLQDIPAEQASLVIASWIANLVEVAEPEIVAFFEEKLNEVAEMFNAQEVAENLSTIIHNKILEVFSPENIYDLIYPLIEQISEINTEAAAQKITDWLFGMELIKDNFTEEQALEALSSMISQLIGNINVDEASQKLVDLIMQSEFVKNINGVILKQLIELKTYELLIDLGKNINAIDRIEFSIKKQPY
jgi:hypothetical protein